MEAARRPRAGDRSVGICLTAGMSDAGRIVGACPSLKPREPDAGCGVSGAWALALAGAVFAWLALCDPPAAAIRLQRAWRANVVLHARVPFPPQTQPLLDDVLARVSRSAALRRRPHVSRLPVRFAGAVRGVRAVEPARRRSGAGLPGRQCVPAALQHRTRPADRSVGRRQAGRANARVLHRARGDAHDDRRSPRPSGGATAASRRSSRKAMPTTSRSRGRSTSRPGARRCCATRPRWIRSARVSTAATS